MESSNGAENGAVSLALPMPDGSYSRFDVVESPIMEPALAAKFPEIRTYAGQGTDDATTTLRFTATAHGLYAFVYSPCDAVVVVPIPSAEPGLHASYRQQDVPGGLRFFGCSAVPELPGAALAQLAAQPDPAALVRLRTYRLAVAAQGEYTQFHGGTVASALAAIVATVNQVNAVYERELALRFVLVANNDRIIYLDPDTDPYSTNSASALLLDQNQANLDAVIGPANYDIGHVFNRGGGGRGQVGSACVNGLKAKGASGLPNPAGSVFDIDFVCHELGHQFGAGHTWNGTNGFCTPDQWWADFSYEPGSGSTIMSYAGTCAADTVLPNSIPFFHSASLSQMTAHLNGLGNCANLTTTDNHAPLVSAGAVHTIPKQTPFRLTASATDPDGDPVTYCWEQRDLGPRQPLTGPGSEDNGRSPLFRVFPPTVEPTRMFPNLSALLANLPSHAEQLPNTQRTLNFRVTARDNRSGGGGTSYADTQVSVATNAGPFTVTAPSGPVTWAGRALVRWDVAGTTNSPVSVALVNVLLSLDGGLSYPIALAASTPNDGEAEIDLPALSTSQARIKVEAVDNIFFDISDSNFTIAHPLLVVASAIAADESGEGAMDPGETVTVTFSILNIGSSQRTNVMVALVTQTGVELLSQPQLVALWPTGDTVVCSYTFRLAEDIVCGESIWTSLRVSEAEAELELGTVSWPVGKQTLQSFTAANTETIRPELAARGSPYPSGIAVSNVAGVISKLTVTLSNLTDMLPDLTDVVLVGPGGQSVLLLSDLSYNGGAFPMPTVSLTFDDDAPQTVAEVYPIISGTYQPTDLNFYPGQLPPPAPSGPHASRLSAFTGLNPNGTWKLFAADHFFFVFDPTNQIIINSRIRDGWSLTIQTSNSLCCVATDSLALEMNDSSDPVRVGDTLTYTIVVTNRGAAVVDQVILSDLLPGGVVLDSMSTSQGSCVVNELGLVTCDLGPLAPATTAQIELNVITQVTGTITNQATITSAAPHDRPENNVATVLTTLEAPLSVSISHFTLAEGDSDQTNAVFRVLLSSVSSVPVSVDFLTSDGTATAGIDYVATNGTISFAPGQISQILLVPVIGDTRPESDETFAVELFNPSNAPLAELSGVGTILNDDSVLTISGVTLPEGNLGIQSVAFAVNVNPPKMKTISVGFATSNDTAAAATDYGMQVGRLIIPPGVANTHIAVVVAGDTLVEADETFVVSLFDPTNATLGFLPQATAIIVNDDGLPGQLDRFVWQPIPSPQDVDLLFTATLSAHDASGVPIPDYNGSAMLTALKPAVDYIVGTNRVASEIPLRTSARAARVQSILLANEMDGAGRLTALALEVVTPPGQALTDWTIRIMHTTRTNFTTLAWEGAGWHVAHQSTATVSSPGWVTFPFSLPFDYDGTNNLIVDFSFNNATSSTAGSCRGRNRSGSNRSLFAESDGVHGEPRLWSESAGPRPASTALIPNIRWTIEPIIPINPSFASFNAGVWNGELLLSEAIAGLRLRADDGRGHLGISDSIEVLSGLHLEIAPIEAAVVLRFNSHVGRTYLLQTTISLAAPISWEPVIGVEPILGTGGLIEMTDPLSEQPSQKFYRVQVNR